MWKPKLDRYLSRELRQGILHDLSAVAEWVEIPVDLATRAYCRDHDDKLMKTRLVCFEPPPRHSSPFVTKTSIRRFPDEKRRRADGDGTGLRGMVEPVSGHERIGGVIARGRLNGGPFTRSGICVIGD